MNIQEFLKTGGNKNFRIEKLFSGEHGICGLVSTDVGKAIFKVSKYLDFSIEHEHKVMLSLAKIKDLCPHFPMTYGIYDMQTNPELKEKQNPFQVHTKYPITRKFILEEYIQGKQLLHTITNDREDELYSVIKQVLCAINISGKLLNFSHYDLHSSNILLEKCNYDRVHYYILSDKIKVLVPTFGNIPKIIDMGFSYCKDLENTSMCVDISHINSGYLSSEYSWFSDYKVFLKSLLYDVSNFKDYSLLSNIVTNLLQNLKIKRKSGWDITSKEVEEPYEEAIYRTISSYKDLDKNSVFRKYVRECFDIIISLTTYPIQKYSENNKHNKTIFQNFMNEFRKIEKLISISHYKLYALKLLVESANNLREDYVINPENTILKFKREFESAIDKYAQFFNVNVNYEILLCSLYVLSDCFTHNLYNSITPIIENKLKHYASIIPKDGDEIVEIFNINMENCYEYTTETEIYIYNIVDQTSQVIKLTEEEIQKMNDLDSRDQQPYLDSLL